MKNQKEIKSYRQELEKYRKRLTEIRIKMQNNEHGSNIAREINDSFWRDLDAHEKRMDEQLRNAKSTENNLLQEDAQNVKSLYEATRSFLSKYDLA